MPIWFEEISLSELNQQYNINMLQHLGIQITGISESSLTGTLPVDYRNQQPFGLLHGGASLVLAESLGSMASNLCLDLKQHCAVGQSIHGNHVKSVSHGIVTGIATPIHLGKKSHVWSIEIRDEQEALVCSAQLTTAIIER
jgi:1,4-dihydroxy-2-naphthoyl-CoA hydrolase